MYIKKQYIYWLFVLLALIVVDCLVGMVGEYMMRQIRTDKISFAKDYYRLNIDTSDVVIVGSSRAAHHYVSSILCDSIASYTGKAYSVYNAGVDGHYLMSNLCVIESILDRCKPKLIILDAYDPELSMANARSNLDASILSYSINTHIKACIDQMGWKERCKCSSNMYRYNLNMIPIFSLYLSKYGLSDGYEPLSGTKLDTLCYVAPVHDADLFTADYFKKVMTRLKDLQIPLVVVGSPCYKPINSNEVVCGLCCDCDIPYLDYYKIEPFASHPEYFYDDNHLNDEGARLFTSLLYASIKQILD